jgi:hypothetical protein
MAADPEQAAEEEDLGPDGGGYPDTNEIRERNRCNCVEFKRGRTQVRARGNARFYQLAQR